MNTLMNWSGSGIRFARAIRSGVLTPLLILNGLVTIPSMAAGTFAEGVYQLFLMALAGVVVVVTIGTFIYFAVKDPDRIHSEQYQLAAQGYRLLGDERMTPEIAQRIVANVPSIMNPQETSRSGEQI
jgi:hypothetical protein